MRTINYSANSRLRNLLLILLLGFSTITSSTNTYAQTSSSSTSSDSYEIVDGNSNASPSFLQAFESANWDRYRFQSKRRTLNFHCGVEIELLSAQELSNAGIDYNEQRIMADNVEPSKDVIFKIKDNGHVMELHSHAASKKASK